MNPFSGLRGSIIALLLGLLVLLPFGVWFKSTFIKTTYSSPWTQSSVAYGVNVDITALIPGTNYTVKTANGGNFFDLAAQLGINTLRITDVLWASTGQGHSRADWNYVFDHATAHHMQVILLIVDVPGSTPLAVANTLLGTYGLAQSPALWMVDLANEPDLSDTREMAALHDEATYVHQVAPKIPVTIGGWKNEIAGRPGVFDWQDPADVSKLIDLVDVVSPHLYNFEQASQKGIQPAQWTRNFLAAVRQNAQGKPVLLEEFGASNGLAPTSAPTPSGSLQWQTSVYQGVLQEVAAEHNQGVIGSVAWIFTTRPPWPAPGVYEGDMTGWAFVLDNGQRLLPASQVFSQVAHG